MIDRAHAVHLVEELLQAEERRYAMAGSVVPLQITNVIEHRLGWVVQYQSQAYLRSGNVRDMIVPNPPYLVDRHDGSVHSIPVPDYVGGRWEEDYETRIKPPLDPDPWEDVPFATEVFTALEAEGRIAAVRLLRGHASVLKMAQAVEYVTALSAGERPRDELIDLAKPPESFSGMLGIVTLTGPNPMSPK